MPIHIVNQSIGILFLIGMSSTVSWLMWPARKVHGLWFTLPGMFWAATVYTTIYLVKGWLA